MSSIATGSPDKREIITVFLVNSTRRKYRKFYCINCGFKVCELEGSLIYSISDVDDSSRLPRKAKLTFRCDGKYCANTYYRFTLN